MKKSHTGNRPPVELYLNATVNIKLEYGKTLQDGTQQFNLIIETGKGVIVQKGFRVDKHFTDVMMPMLPMGTRYVAPFYLAAIPPDIRKDILEVMQKEEAKNAKDAVSA